MDIETIEAAHTATQSIVLFDRNEDIAIIHLGDSSEKAVILSQQRMRSLTEAIARVKLDTSIKGLVLIGAHVDSFCAGADINVIQQVTNAEEAAELARLGQRIFNEIANLTIPTIAAISGPCVGGGFELVLACKWRIALDTPKTKIGLPEIKIGIVPGFGGTQRLPRLIGLPGALDIILKGKVVAAKEALKRGMIDHIYQAPEPSNAFGQMLDFACAVIRGEERINRRPLSLAEKAATGFGPARNFALKKAREVTLKTTKGHYPAPIRAIDSIEYGLKNGLEKGLEYEALALGETLVTPECKALVHVYFLTEEATKRWRRPATDFSQAQVGVIGAGTMGLGIVSTFLQAGLNVVIVEPIAAARSAATERLKALLTKKRSLSSDKIDKMLAAVNLTEDYSALKGSLLVVEAIIEDMATKKQVLSLIDDQVGPETIIATNTSSLSISEMASSISHPERIIGMHFFNPAERMPLVEIIRAHHTNERSLALTAALTVNIGKYPVVVNEVAGFLVNRTLSAFLVEGVRLLSEGYTVESIDKLATKFGMPMGPLRLLDEIGLDVAGEVARIIADAYGERMQGPAFAKALVEQQRLGKKSGKGFYIHQADKAEPDKEIYQLLKINDPKPIPAAEAGLFTDRLILPMLAEAVRCLDENVAGFKSKEAAEQIDLASVMGTGFAPFRGGILYYAEQIGAANLKSKMDELAKRFGAIYAPTEGISSRAQSREGFIK